ncbi:MAG: hypothetical protein ACI3VN_01755 [Candidatus Onthomonas sp.]
MTFTFADLTLTLKAAHSITITDHFQPFSGGRGSCRYEAEFRRTERLPELSGPSVADAPEYQVFQCGDGSLIRCFRDPLNGDKPYAVTSMDLAQHRVLVEYLPEGEQFLNETGNCFFHIGWERIMAQENRLILHAACVDTIYGGLLFSGPSGIGKSTQAGLWERYRNARQINGDRPILRLTEKGWLAYGSPYAGSSRFHVNECCPVRAIILLRQAGTCSIRPMRGLEAFQRVFAGLTVNSWDSGFVAKACDLAEALTARIPVYELACTPDLAAVELLERELSKGDTPWN